MRLRVICTCCCIHCSLVPLPAKAAGDLLEVHLAVLRYLAFG